MDALIKKIRHKPDPLDDEISEDLDPSLIPSELSLVDDDYDTFPASGFSGKLSFAQGDCDSPRESPDTDISSHPVPYEGSQISATRVTFEVTSADVIKDTTSSSVLPGHSGHVEYTITITSSTGLKDIPTQRICRYSDFEHLNKLLKKKFSHHLSPVVFPSKVFVGNFSRETIAKRSRAFEQYLTHLHSILDVRYSSEFTEFFTGDDYAQAMRSFREGKYLQAIPLLERYLPTMEKLYGNSHNKVSVAVCALVACHHKVESLRVADTYATLALQSLPDSPLTVPLLNLTARLRWSLGRNKLDVELRLQQLKEKGVQIDGAQELEDEIGLILRSNHG